jgi:hypothetical protein
MLVEQWNTESGLHKHIASDAFKRILAVLDYSIEPPEVRFEGIAQTAGMELIEAARSEKVMNETKRKGGGI